MKVFFSLFLILELFISSVFAQSQCHETYTQPLSKDHFSMVNGIHKKLVCGQNQSELVISKAMGSCLIEVIKGAFDFLVAQIKGIWDLLELSYDLAKKFGSFIVDYLKASWNGTQATFWAEKYLQGNNFFSNMVKTVKEIPTIITKVFQQESEKFRCMPLEKKVDFICHTTGRVGPEIVLMAMGVWKGVGMLKSLMPKLNKIVEAEKIIKTSKIVEVKAVATLAESKQVTQGVNLSKTIKHHPRPAESFEFKKVGTVIKDQSELKNLKDGPYIYVIDSHGNTVISPRFPNLSSKTEQVLAKHHALNEQLVESVGKKQVAAAGEFYIDAGKVTEVNNGSGGFRGTKEHLDFGIEQLKQKGLNIEEKTKVKDYTSAPIDPEHFQEKQIAMEIQNWAKNPDTVKDFENFKDAYKHIYQSGAYKSDKLGKLDDMKVAQDFISYMDLYPEKSNIVMGTMHYLTKCAAENSRQFGAFIPIAKGFMTEAERKESILLMKYMAEHGRLPLE